MVCSQLKWYMVKTSVYERRSDTGDISNYLFYKGCQFKASRIDSLDNIKPPWQKSNENPRFLSLNSVLYHLLHTSASHDLKCLFKVFITFTKT